MCADARVVLLAAGFSVSCVCACTCGRDQRTIGSSTRVHMCVCMYHCPPSCAHVRTYVYAGTPRRRDQNRLGSFMHAHTSCGRDQIVLGSFARAVAHVDTCAWTRARARAHVCGHTCVPPCGCTRTFVCHTHARSRTHSFITARTRSMCVHRLCLRARGGGWGPECRLVEPNLTTGAGGGTLWAVRWSLSGSGLRPLPQRRATYEHPHSTCVRGPRLKARPTGRKRTLAVSPLPRQRRTYGHAEQAVVPQGPQTCGCSRRSDSRMCPQTCRR